MADDKVPQHINLDAYALDADPITLEIDGLVWRVRPPDFNKALRVTRLVADTAEEDAKPADGREVTATDWSIDVKLRTLLAQMEFGRAEWRGFRHVVHWLLCLLPDRFQAARISVRLRSKPLTLRAIALRDLSRNFYGSLREHLQLIDQTISIPERESSAK